MSKTWYPVINYEDCIECGACFNKCSHEVFKLKDKCPSVVNTEGCVKGCHGCGNLCPVGAIEYVGDDTGWVPPGKKEAAEEASCCEKDVNKSCCSGSDYCN